MLVLQQHRRAKSHRAALLRRGVRARRSACKALRTGAMAAASLAPDLDYLLEEEGVAQQQRDLLRDLGYGTLKLFSIVGDDRTQV